jgi:DNA-binding response OmpR family regulator
LGDAAPSAWIWTVRGDRSDFTESAWSAGSVCDVKRAINAGLSEGVVMANVLVVEDNYTMGIQTASIVEEAGYSVAGPEASVDAAQKVLGRQKIDLALLDVNLGSERVFPIAQMLDTMRIPYIFVTGCSASAIPARYRHSLIVQKPYSPGLLIAQMHRFLG